MASTDALGGPPLRGPDSVSTPAAPVVLGKHRLQSLRAAAVIATRLQSRGAALQWSTGGTVRSVMRARMQTVVDRDATRGGGTGARAADRQPLADTTHARQLTAAHESACSAIERALLAERRHRDTERSLNVLRGVTRATVQQAIVEMQAFRAPADVMRSPAPQGAATSAAISTVDNSARVARAVRALVMETAAAGAAVSVALAPAVEAAVDLKGDSERGASEEPASEDGALDDTASSAAGATVSSSSRVTVS